MAKIKCLRSDYKRASDDQLDAKAMSVVEGLTDNAASFPAPPMTPAVLQSHVELFVSTFIAYKRGGLDQKPPFLSAKETLLDALDELADYVDEVADGKLNIVVESGFVPTKSTATPTTIPEHPVGITAKYGNNPGELVVECPVVEGAEYYGLLVTVGAPATGFSLVQGKFLTNGSTTPYWLDLTKSRRKNLFSLARGTNYYFYMFAGNSAGVSGLSIGLEMMAL